MWIDLSLTVEKEEYCFGSVSNMIRRILSSITVVLVLFAYAAMTFPVFICYDGSVYEECNTAKMSFPIFSVV